jgi:hypothetical protein
MPMRKGFCGVGEWTTVGREGHGRPDPGDLGSSLKVFENEGDQGIGGSYL